MKNKNVTVSYSVIKEENAERLYKHVSLYKEEEKKILERKLPIAECTNAQAVGEMLEDFKTMGECLNQLMNDTMDLLGEDYDEVTSKPYWEKAMDLLRKMGLED